MHDRAKWTPDEVAQLKKLLDAGHTPKEIAELMRVRHRRVLRKMAQDGLQMTAQAKLRSDVSRQTQLKRHAAAIHSASRRLIRPSLPMIPPGIAAAAAQFLRRHLPIVWHMGREDPEKDGIWRVGRRDMHVSEMVEMAQAKGFVDTSAEFS